MHVHVYILDMTEINGMCSINWCTCFREETPLHNYYVFITRVSIILVKRTLRISSKIHSTYQKHFIKNVLNNHACRTKIWYGNVAFDYYDYQFIC